MNNVWSFQQNCFKTFKRFTKCRFTKCHRRLIPRWTQSKLLCSNWRLQPVLFDTYTSTFSCFIFFLLQIIWWFILSTFGGFLLMYFIYSIREKRGYTIDPLYKGLLFSSSNFVFISLFMCHGSSTSQIYFKFVKRRLQNTIKWCYICIFFVVFDIFLIPVLYSSRDMFNNFSPIIMLVTNFSKVFWKKFLTDSGGSCMH